MPLVLCSDFGSQSLRPGAMKGIIAGIAPDAPVIDLTHELPAADTRRAALLLLQAVKYFPTGTIFCVVSGDGDARPIAAQAGGYIFVGRDDGVLSYALYNQPHAWAADITDALDGEIDPSAANAWTLLPAVAALIHAGAPLETLGQPIPDMYGLEPPPLRVANGALHGEVLYVDGDTAVTSIGLLRWTDTETIIVRPLVGDGVWTVPVAFAQVTVGDRVLRGIWHRASGAGPTAVAESEYLKIIGGALTVGQPVRLSW